MRIRDTPIAGKQGQCHSMLVVWGIKSPLGDWLHQAGFSLVRKCWTLRGLRPKVPYQTKYEWRYLYSALEMVHGGQ